jgi:hypothetical protein
MLLIEDDAVRHLIEYVRSGGCMDYREVILYPFTITFIRDEFAVGIIYGVSRNGFYYRDNTNLMQQLMAMDPTDLVIKSESFQYKGGMC